MIFFEDYQRQATIHIGGASDVLRKLPENSIHCVVTSPPYFRLRDYGVAGAIGSEQTPQEYVNSLVEVFRGVHRVLRNDGTVWLNLGDKYENKQLLMIPAEVVKALKAEGWFLRSQIIWYKKDPMPEGMTDRPTQSYEVVYLLTKSPTYFYDGTAIAEPGEYHDGSDDQHTRNSRNVWTVNTATYISEHFAVMPRALAVRCIKAGSSIACCSKCGAPQRRMTESTNSTHHWTKQAPRTDSPYNAQSDIRHGKLVSRITTGWEVSCDCQADTVSCTVLDPFGGSGTTAIAACEEFRNAILIELNPEYAKSARERLMHQSIDVEMRSSRRKIHARTSTQTQTRSGRRPLLQSGSVSPTG